MNQKIEETVISDLSKFGARERHIAEKLLRAWREQGLPKNFWEEGVTIAYNQNSGYVFLTNNDYQVVMLEGEHLESFYSCPQCGEEGTWYGDNIQNHGKCDTGVTSNDKECRRWVQEIKRGRK